jgi:hypothetical protein
MARTKLAVKEVRVPTKLVRATAIAAKMADLDDYLDGIGTSDYDAAGAISPNDGLAVLTASVAAQAMTLADGTVTGQHLVVVLRAKATAGTAVVTPANLAGGTTLTFSAVGQKARLVWTGADWTPVPGYTAVLA